MKGLAGKSAVITGGASGIGAATVERFIQEGIKVIVIDHNQEALDRVDEQYPKIELTLRADVSDAAAVEEAFSSIDSEIDDIDILINNAGISIRHDFLNITSEDWLKVLNTNLNGVFYVAQQAAKRMKERGGVIINMGSTNGLVGYPFYSDYNASKAGVIELSKSMALELAPKVRVNAVCPGYILTPMQEAEYTPEMMKVVNDKLPLKRHGKPEEVAALFAFLCSEEAPYITGQTFIIDGGETAGGLASR